MPIEMTLEQIVAKISPEHESAPEEEARCCPETYA
jgi:hypothetical protein